MIKLSINPFFFLLFFLALFQGFLYEVLLLLTIVFIHELGHAFTAMAYGWRVRKIELLPFGGVAEMEEHGNKPAHQEAAILLSGPLMNVIMIGVALILMYAGIWASSFSLLFIEYNLLIFGFNLLPIWPLDGGKLFQIIFSQFLPYQKAIKHSLCWSGGCLFLFIVAILLFYPYYLSLWVIAFFLLFAHWLEFKQYQYQYMRFLLERYKGEELAVGTIRSIAVYEYERIQDALAKMFRNGFHYFCIVDKHGKLIHILSEKELLEAHFSQTNLQGTLKDVQG